MPSTHGQELKTLQPLRSFKQGTASHPITFSNSEQASMAHCLFEALRNYMYEVHYRYSILKRYDTRSLLKYQTDRARTTVSCVELSTWFTVTLFLSLYHLKVNLKFNLNITSFDCMITDCETVLTVFK